MTMPSDPEPTRPDDDGPRAANPGGGTGGTAVVPPTEAGASRWRGLAIAGAAVVAVLVILLVLF